MNSPHTQVATTADTAATSPPSTAATVRPAGTAYRAHAGSYDHRTRLFQHWRDLLVDRLPVQRGETVIDVGCGTGLCLPGLQDKVGPSGKILGIDESPDMIALATARTADHGWHNVTLTTSPVADATIDITADAALFCAVHDVMQSPAALANIVAHLRPGAPVAAVGGKWPTPWLWPLKPWVSNLHAPFITDFTDFDQPWHHLAALIPNLQVSHIAYTTGYLAYGNTPTA